MSGVYEKEAKRKKAKGKSKTGRRQQVAESLDTEEHDMPTPTTSNQGAGLDEHNPVSEPEGEKAMSSTPENQPDTGSVLSLNPIAPTPKLNSRPSSSGSGRQKSATLSTRKTQSPNEKNLKDFSNLDPKDYGIEFDEEEMLYEPPVRDEALPDLYKLLDSLQDGDSELVARRAPPTLYTRPEHVTKYKKISELRTEIEQEEIDPYVKEFEDGIHDDVLMVGSVRLEDIQDEERRLRDEHISYQEQEAELARVRQQRLLLREEDAKYRVAQFVKQRRLDIAKREELLKQKERLLLERLNKAFLQAEDQMTGALEFRKAEVKTLYGDLTVSDGFYGGSRGRRWKLDWNRAPQPIQVKLKCLRGVKDKLPAGRYVMMVSLYNRLGGHAMRWSKLKGQQWSGATLPIFHEGHFTNVEMKMNQNVFTVLPSKPSLRPGMVLVFELFLLRGSVVQTDRVVGWGAFPICDGQFDLIQGKYKCPIIRGEVDPQIQTFETLESLMSSDIDHWLSNMYFEIIRLPRYMGGQKEYEVELHFSSALTSFPDRVKLGWEEYKDGEKPEPGSQLDIQSTDNSGSNLSVPSTSTVSAPAKSELSTRKVKLSEKKNLHDRLGDIAKGPTYNSRRWHKDKKLKLEDSSDESDLEQEYEKIVNKEREFKPVQNAPGMYYKKHLYSPQDRYYRDLFSMMPKSQVLDHLKKKRPLTHVEELEQHTLSVQPAFSGKGRMAEPGNEKLIYLSRQFLSELGLSQWRSREFWGMVLICFLVFFIRMYLHYVAQWGFLQATGIPVNNFQFYAYTVNLNYQSSLLSTGQEIAVVVLGPLMNILVLCLLVTIAWLLPKILGFFPDLFYKFILGFGVMTFFDPLLILIVDCCMQVGILVVGENFLMLSELWGIRKLFVLSGVEMEKKMQRYLNLGGTAAIGDLAKLWWHFERTQGSGVSGALITVFLYVFTAFMTASILYMYFLRLHNNGRLLDVFWRLHGNEEQFFMPYDLEMSNYEMNYIAKKAEQWRGEEGERRKTAVYDYIWEEHDEIENAWSKKNNLSSETEDLKRRREITTHVSIHLVHLDGLRELYRHFLRLPDGAIVEVFGEVKIPGMNKIVTDAVEGGSKELEKLLAVQGKQHRHGKQSTPSSSQGSRTSLQSAVSSLSDSVKKTK